MTPPKSPEVPSQTPEVQPEVEPEVEPVDLDDTLPADKTLPPEPDLESEKNSENEVADEPSAVTIDEEIIDDVIDEEIDHEEVVDESQSVHSAATEASGIQFKEEKPISDTISTPRGSVASMTSQKSKKSIQKSYSPVIIQIKRLEIVENGPVKDNNVFIEFDFCGEVEETNESLPFPTEENPSHFDFRKEFNFKVRLTSEFLNSNALKRVFEIPYFGLSLNPKRSIRLMRFIFHLSMAVPSIITFIRCFYHMNLPHLR